MFQVSEHAATPISPPDDAIGRSLFLLSRGFAASGGLVLVAVSLMSVASIASRTLTGNALLGDFELVQLGSAVAVAAFLPWGQMRGSHVFVDFFTTGLRPRARARLDAIGALLLGFCAAVVAWRMLIATFEIRASGETSMLLGVPTWYAYLLMTPSFALLAATGLYTSWLKFRGREA
jgi:TRAP-type C4-dicarboxylate transport system permease small subunit